MGLWFSKRRNKSVDRVEAKFQTVVDLIKDLDRREFNRLKDGMELCWQGYQKVSQTKTTEEKENADIDEAEKILEKDSGRS